MNHFKPITEILVPLDFSDCSLKALGFAKQLASACGARLHLLYVDDDPVLVPAETDPSYRQEHAEKMAENFSGLLSAEEQEKYRAITTVETGTAYHEIEKYAEKNRVDMIVMGTHGRSAVAEIFVGSVSQHVMKHACCPVTAVRE